MKLLINQNRSATSFDNWIIAQVSFQATKNIRICSFSLFWLKVTWKPLWLGQLIGLSLCQHGFWETVTSVFCFFFYLTAQRIHDEQKYICQINRDWVRAHNHSARLCAGTKWHSWFTLKSLNARVHTESFHVVWISKSERKQAHTHTCKHTHTHTRMHANTHSNTLSHCRVT